MADIKETARKVTNPKNRKIILGISSLIVTLGVVTVCSFIPFKFDWEHIDWPTFWTDELIIIAISIISLVSAMFIGQAGNAQQEKSNLAKARAKFFVTVEQIVNLSAFGQWVKKVLQPNDIKAIKERKMRSVGIEDFSILDLEYAEIRSLLETPQKYNGRYYKGLSKKQIEVLLEIKKGNLNVDLVEPEYYLSVKNLIDTRTITERSSKEGLKKGLYFAKSIVGKVLITIISAVILASLATEWTGDATAAEKAEAALRFASRVWAMISSMFMGYVVGVQVNDLDAEYIEMRVAVQKMFLQDKDFKPLDQQEEAKQAFIERVKKEQVTQPSQLENNSDKLPYYAGDMLFKNKEE